MKKTLSILSLSFLACFVMNLTPAATLMSGAQIYTMPINKTAALTTSPSGIIINQRSDEKLNLQGTAPLNSSFPPTVGEHNSASYSVKVDNTNGFTWTAPFSYTYQDGNGCYLQFGRDAMTGALLVAVASTGGMTNCSVSGSMITIMENTINPF